LCRRIGACTKVLYRREAQPAKIKLFSLQDFFLRREEGALHLPRWAQALSERQEHALEEA
jgi:hypothetical protein